MINVTPTDLTVLNLIFSTVNKREQILIFRRLKKLMSTNAKYLAIEILAA